MDSDPGSGRDADRGESDALGTSPARGATERIASTERGGCSSKPGPETGGPQRPNRHLPATWPEPATPSLRAHGALAKPSLPAAGSVGTPETFMWHWAGLCTLGFSLSICSMA